MNFLSLSPLPPAFKSLLRASNTLKNTQENVHETCAVLVSNRSPPRRFPCSQSGPRSQANGVLSNLVLGVSTGFTTLGELVKRKLLLLRKIRSAGGARFGRSPGEIEGPMVGTGCYGERY